MKKGVNVIIIDNRNSVLVLKRSSESKFSPNLWNLPGGKIENDESLKQAVIRETKEETNLEVEPENDYFSIYYYPNGKLKNAKTAVHAFKAKLIGGKILLDKTHTGFRWVSKNDWKNLDYTPSAEATLKELFK